MLVKPHRIWELRRPSTISPNSQPPKGIVPVGGVRSPEMQTLYRGVKHKERGADGKMVEKTVVGLGAGEVKEGELQRRVQQTTANEAQGMASDLLPSTRPDRFVRWSTPPNEPGRIAPSIPPISAPVRPRRCDQIHEVDRILRARSPLGILCTPVDAPALGQAAIGMLYESAKQRMQRRPPGYDVSRAPAALKRLELARDAMLDPQQQLEERQRWRTEGWTRWVTTHLRCAINVAGLEAYASTPAANVIPVNKHGKPYGGTGKQLIEWLLQRVERLTPHDEWGTVEVRYWHGHMGSALIDAGLVSTSREMPVPPDWPSDPFSLPKKIRGIALGSFVDFDDAGSHPRARAQIVQPGAQIAQRFSRQ